MKFIDMFAGVGGIRLGMEQAGHTCVSWIEWDKFARQSYHAIHKPDGEFTEKDINDVKAELLPKADCWCFGFPCQDISVAGKQGGFTNGKRSSLFFKVTGLIRELEEEDKPSYLFIENVKNLLSINKGWDFAKLLIEMDEIGYDVEWDVLDSAEVVPQHRERIFIVGHLRGRSTRKVFPIERENRSTSETNEIVRLFNGRQEGTYGSQDILSPDGISTTLNTMSGGGREPKILDDQGRTNKRLKPLSMSPTLRSQAHGNEPKIVIPVLTPDRIKKRQNGRRFKTNGEPEFTLTGQDRHGILTNNTKISKSVPERIKSAKNGGDNQEPKVMVREATKKGFDIAGIGDSINFSQPNSKTRRGRVGHGIANTMTTSNSMATLTGDLRIRKLTPRECWRLQGFPDWAFNRAKQAGLSDSQLYKQAGNSVTVPVIKAIAEGMALDNVEDE